MPFRSQAQRAYMYIHHPDIAKRRTSEYGGGGKGLPYKVPGHKGGFPNQLAKGLKPGGTPSNETNAPLVSKVPRIPGMKRDFGMLKPSGAKRFAPKSQPVPNEWEAMAQKGVEYVHSHQHRHTELGRAEHPKGLHTRDIHVAEKAIQGRHTTRKG